MQEACRSKIESGGEQLTRQAHGAYGFIDACGVRWLREAERKICGRGV